MADINAEIDKAIFGFFDEWKRQMKVAMLIGSIILDFRKKGIVVGEELITERILCLVKSNHLVVSGDIEKWRQSEIISKQYQ